MASKSQIASLAVGASLIVVAGAPLVSQSLADAAAKEEARRKQVGAPAKVITNKDLPNVPPPEPLPAATTATSAGSDKTDAKDAPKDAKDAAKDAAAGKDQKAAASKDAPKDQAYWSTRAKELQTQLDRDVSFADALQTRINVLTADFAARDDPAQRDAIGRDRQKAIEELDRVRKAIDTDRKSITDFQEEARRASVPPGWLR